MRLKEYFEREIAEMGLEEALRSGDHEMQCYNETILRQILRSREYSDEEIVFAVDEIYRKAGFDELDQPQSIGTAAGQSNG